MTQFVRGRSAARAVVVTFITTCAAIALPLNANAQQRAPTRMPEPILRSRSVASPGADFQTPAQDPEESEADKMSKSGFFLSAVGMLGGAAVGSGIGNSRCGQDCVGRYAAGGAMMAGATLAPAGVYIAKEERSAGRLFLSTAASFGAGAAVWGLFNAVPGKPVALAPFIAMPVQVWAAMKIQGGPKPEN